MEATISTTPQFVKICNTIRHLIQDRNLLPKDEQKIMSNDHILNLFKKADGIMGSPTDIFPQVLKCDKTDNINKVFSTHYLLYTTLRSGMGIKIGEVK